LLSITDKQEASEYTLRYTSNTKGSSARFAAMSARRRQQKRATNASVLMSVEVIQVSTAEFTPKKQLPPEDSSSMGRCMDRVYLSPSRREPCTSAQIQDRGRRDLKCRAESCHRGTEPCRTEQQNTPRKEERCSRYVRITSKRWRPTRSRTSLLIGIRNE
jgi:hypothetical protein